MDYDIRGAVAGGLVDSEDGGLGKGRREYTGDEGTTSAGWLFIRCVEVDVMWALGWMSI